MNHSNSSLIEAMAQQIIRSLRDRAFVYFTGGTPPAEMTATVVEALQSAEPEGNAFLAFEEWWADWDRKGLQTNNAELMARDGFRYGAKWAVANKPAPSVASGHYGSPPESVTRENAALAKAMAASRAVASGSGEDWAWLDKAIRSNLSISDRCDGDEIQLTHLRAVEKMLVALRASEERCRELETLNESLKYKRDDYYCTLRTRIATLEAELKEARSAKS